MAKIIGKIIFKQLRGEELLVCLYRNFLDGVGCLTHKKTMMGLMAI